MKELSRQNRAFIKELRAQFDIDAEQLIREVVAYVEPQLGIQGPMQLVIGTASNAPGWPLSYERSFPEHLDREVALGVVVFRLMDDLERATGVWAAVLRISTALHRCAEAIDEDVRALYETAQKTAKEIRELESYGVEVSPKSRDRLALLEDLVVLVRDIGELSSESADVAGEEGVRERGRGKPRRDTLIEAEGFLMRCGFTHKRIAELLGDGGDKDGAVQRIGARHRKRRQREAAP